MTAETSAFSVFVETPAEMQPYLPLPSQPQPLLIYRPRRDGRLSRSSPGRYSDTQPPDCKSGTLPHSH